MTTHAPGSRALVSQGLDLHLAFLSIHQDSDGTDRVQHLQKWLAYEESVAQYMASGALDPSTASVISAIATNVHINASSHLELDHYMEEELTALARKMELLAAGDDGKRVSDVLAADTSRQQKTESYL